MKLLMMRHAQTRGNIEKRYNGVTDDPLCAEGIEAAKRTGVNEKVECVFTSPRIRAIQTANIMFPNARKIVIDGLAEMNFGDFEGKNFMELSEDPDYLAWVEGNCEGRCPNGDDKVTAVTRAKNAFKSLAVDVSATYDDSKPLILVVHGGVIMSVLSSYALFDGDAGYFDWLVNPGEGYFADLYFGRDGNPEILNIEKVTDLSCLDAYY